VAMVSKKPHIRKNYGFIDFLRSR